MKTYLLGTLGILAGLLWGEISYCQEAPGSSAPKRLSVYYFGNSLTGCTDPRDHEALAKPAGKEWKTWAFLGAGWQLWQHRYAIEHSGVELKRDSRGDLTIDPASIEHSTNFHVKRFLGVFGDKWDAIVLQPFSMGLTWKCTEMWGVKFDKETDIGDIASASDLITIYLSLNPRGKVFIYQNWPPMEPGKVPPPDQLPNWAKRPDARITRAEFPLRDQFDYEQAWLGGKYKPSPDPERRWLHENARSKDYHDQLFAALKARFPQLYKEGRLRVIPVGDIFLELHRKAKAGAFDGIKDIGEYYTDVQHIRGGLPRYTAAAAFYACLFEEPPDKLDWKIYNDASRYGEDKHHDSLPILEITPERAMIVNETVWEVICRHPDAKPRQK
ncbi:MAG: hypothetical protein ACK4VP_06415 [Nitrospira sp.]